MSSDQTPSARAGDPFAELSRIMLADQPLDTALGTIATLAKQVLRVPTEASITLISDGRPRTVAFTGQPALDLDERQYADERGPCLDAASAGQRLLVSDTGTEHRWRRYAEAAARSGIRSSLSLPLPVQQQVVGALNFYADEPDAFDEDTIELAETFAGYAAVAVANATVYASTTALAEQMRDAMASRAVIEQAKGILMARERIGADAAFDLLVRSSQKSHRKLREVAELLVESVTGRPASEPPSAADAR